MNQANKHQFHRNARRTRVRKHLAEATSRPRLHVFRSNAHVYAQIIDDNVSKTLVAATEQELKDVKGTKTERAQAVGTLIAEKAKKAKITEVKFDRGANKYHGRIKALADAAREGGLVF